MKPIILFDLDNTLLDTVTWSVELVLPVLAEALGVDSEDVEVVRKEYRASLAKSTDFDPAHFLDWLHEEFDGDRAQLEKLYYKPEFLRHAIFDDVVPTLTELQPHYTLGIFSEGVESFQNRKLELSGLSTWFKPENTYIFHRKNEPEVLKGLPSSTVIDDREDVINALLMQPEIEPLWLNRHTQLEHSEARTIHTLSDLVSTL